MTNIPNVGNELLLLAQGLLLLVGYFAKRTLNKIEKTQADMLTEVQITNGRVTKIETQIIDHDKQDDDRHKENLDKFHDIFSALSNKK